MLDCHPWDELTEQCFRRVKNYKRQHNLRWSENTQVRLTCSITPIIRKVVVKKPGRIQTAAEPASGTSVPDTYVDDVIKYYLLEAPRINKLLRGDDASWQKLSEAIAGFIHSHLAKCYNLFYSQTPLKDQVEDVINQTYMKLSETQFESFCFDCPFDAWIGKYAVLTAQELSKKHIRYANRHPSLEEMITGTNGLTKSDVIPDAKAQTDMEKRQKLLAVEQVKGCLSPAQAEVISRTLACETSAEIADAMGCTLNAVYILRNRAIKKLRRRLRD